MGSDMEDTLSYEAIVKVLSSMPEKASPQDVTALITNIVLAYNFQSQWGMIAHMAGETLWSMMEDMGENGCNTIH